MLSPSAHVLAAAVSATPVTWATTSGVNKHANLYLSAANLAFAQTSYVGEKNYLRSSAETPSKFIAEFTIGSSFFSFWLGIEDGTKNLGTQVDDALDWTTATALRGGGSTIKIQQNAALLYENTPGTIAASVITVIGDKAAGTASFFFNGTLLTAVTGIAYANWYLFAGNQNFSDTVDITANFAGPFTYPQSGYSPVSS